MANVTPGHRQQNMTVNTQAWQPIVGAGSAQQTAIASTGGLQSMKVPSAAVGMIITADVDVSLSLGSTFAATVSQGYLLAKLTPFPALLVPRQNNWSAAAGSDSTAVKFRAITATGRVNFLFIAGRGG